MDLHNTPKPPKHSNLLSCIKEFRNSQSKQACHPSSTTCWLCIEGDESTRFPFCRTAVCDEFWRGIITHARNACCFQTSTICCRVPDSYATPLRSVPQSIPGRKSLVCTLDLIGYQRQKELTSGFRPVLSNLIMLFFPRFLLNSAIAGQISSRFNSVYFFSGCCSHSQSHEVSQKQ